LKEDALSLAAFALAVALQQAPTAPPAPVAPGVDDPKQLFAKSKCTTCHGEDGRGATESGRKVHTPDFTDPKWAEKASDQQILATIRNGAKDRKGNVRMPAYKTKLAAQQIEELAAYARTFARK
jgi:mono/diheme cytochrome c family protein